MATVRSEGKCLKKESLGRQAASAFSFFSRGATAVCPTPILASSYEEYDTEGLGLQKREKNRVRERASSTFSSQDGRRKRHVRKEALTTVSMSCFRVAFFSIERNLFSVFNVGRKLCGRFTFACLLQVRPALSDFVVFLLAVDTG